MTRGRRREHYQWNMDVVGVEGVEAEAELLAAIVTFFQRVGLSAADVGIKVSNRKVLQAVLERCGVAADQLAAVCVVVDKIEARRRRRASAAAARHSRRTPHPAIPRRSCRVRRWRRSWRRRACRVAWRTACWRRWRCAPWTSWPRCSARTARPSPSCVTCSCWPKARAGATGGTRARVSLERGANARARRAGYGIADWLQLDTSVVRGLAYYTGTVFEGFDRAGALRAICGGGRYDKLLAAYGGEATPMAGFGFGDAVIVELLRDKGLLPAPAHAVDDVVFALDEGLRAAAAGVAARLRAGGRSVDVVVERGRKMKWVLKRAQALGAARLVLLGGEEWAAGKVRVKLLATREEVDVPADALSPQHPAPAAAAGAQ